MTAREHALAAENARLQKMVRVLMDRVENNLCPHYTSDFSLFQSKIVLEEHIRQRTELLDAALRDNQKITRTLKESEAKFRAILDQSLVGIVIAEARRFSYVNPKFAAIFGYSQDEILGMNPLDLALPEERTWVRGQFRQAVANPGHELRFTFRGLRRNGAVVHVEVAGSPPTEMAGRRAMIAVITDITERVRAETEMRALQNLLLEQALRDPLTGLLNRRALGEFLERELVRVAREGDALSLMICDLDHFKAINDHYGHLLGDEVLKAFAGLLTRWTRGSDICCRYGGEEFLIVCPGLSATKMLERAETLRVACADLALASGQGVIRVTASFGIASFPDDGASTDQLLKAADAALYQAKEGGRNRVCCARV